MSELKSSKLSKKKPVLSKAIGGRLLAFFRLMRRFIAVTFLSSLTRRIIFLNLAALGALVFGILYLNQWRTGLIEARVQSLRVQGEIISAAVAASASIDSDMILVDPDRLLQFGTGDALSPLSFFDPSLQFPIDPEKAAPLLGNLVTPTKTRARIYDEKGYLIIDSKNIFSKNQVFPPLKDSDRTKSFSLYEAWNSLLTRLFGSQYALYVEYGQDEGKRYPEVTSALAGAPAEVVRIDKDDDLIISVAVPVQRLNAIVGVLLLSTAPGDIDNIIESERMSVLRIALAAAFVTSILSFLLAGTIAGPIRRLSAAAEKAQILVNDRAEIPDFTYRSDEIGDLSGALRAMTDSLYNRIEAIEKFAADVAHELKNPLTSLKSAVETLPLAKTKKDKDRLNNIIAHDIRRLDRLISDISNASRLDAELARQNASNVDISKLVKTIVSMQKDLAQKQNVNLFIKENSVDNIMVIGHDNRLAQVISNLIENAISFSPKNGNVILDIQSKDNKAIITVMDEGNGIIGDKDKIFNRFYTDREGQNDFGDHSGLGLSISKQIIEAHKGTIIADNIASGNGAIFTISLPLAI